MAGSRFRIPVLVTALAATLLALIAPAQAAGARCVTAWGSLPEVAGPAPSTGAYLDGVRAGQHACYDRLVIDIAGTDAFDSYSVRYVDQVVGESGRPVALRGGARLDVTVGASALTGSGQVAYVPADPSQVVGVTGYRTFRQVVWVQSFEGLSTFGLGVRARLPMRVFVLPPAPGSGRDVRLVVDVAHHW